VAKLKDAGVDVTICEEETVSNNERIYS
jgi:hypothetical protein